MNRQLLLYVALISVITFSCTKESTQETATTTTASSEVTQIKIDQPETFSNKAEATAAATTEFVTYLIRRGQHYSDLRPFKTVNVVDMKFLARFNSTAIYQTVNADNQYDINKLWGFSEGLNNQYNSARIGWGYSNEAIRLYGYVYSRGVRYYQEITTVLPEQEINCSIRIAGSTYVLSANGTSVTLPRGTTASTAKGLQQYPYFGGDEVAPHNISIFIKSL